MNLFSFQGLVGKRDAYAIPARLLDENFSRLKPQTDGTYGINESANGWSLNIFPALPASASVPFLLSYSGGGMTWLDSSKLIPQYAPSSGAITGGGGGEGIPNPPSGTAAWRQIERCDGQTMYVWGTEWA